MKHLYLSEKTRKAYDSIEELEIAEKEFEEKEAEKVALREERSKRAKEVEEAYKHYLELKAKFIEDYKNYHMTLTSEDLPNIPINHFFDIFDRFFNW